MTVTRTDLIDRNGDRMTRVSFPNTAYESFAEAPRQMIGVHFGPTEFAEMSRAKSPKLRLFAEQAGFGKARRHAEDDGDRDALVAQLRKAGAQDAIIQKCDTPALAEWCRLLDSLGGGAEEYDEQGPHGPTSGDGMPGAGGRRREIEEGQNRPGVPTSPGSVLDQPEGGRRAGLDQLAGKSGVSGSAGERRAFDEGDDEDSDSAASAFYEKNAKEFAKMGVTKRDFLETRRRSGLSPRKFCEAGVTTGQHPTFTRFAEGKGNVLKGFWDALPVNAWWR